MNNSTSHRIAPVSGSGRSFNTLTTSDNYDAESFSSPATYTSASSLIVNPSFKN